MRIFHTNIQNSKALVILNIKNKKTCAANATQVFLQMYSISKYIKLPVLYSF